MNRILYPILERALEALAFVVVLMLAGPMLYRASQSIFLFDISSFGMALNTALAVILSPFYVAATVGILLAITLSEKNYRWQLYFLVPALVTGLAANMLSNWIDPLILVTTLVLLLVSIGVMVLWGRLAKRIGASNRSGEKAW